MNQQQKKGQEIWKNDWNFNERSKGKDKNTMCL